MPLRSDRSTRSEFDRDRGVVSFLMFDGPTTVTCRVSVEALDDLARSKRSSAPRDYVDAFERHRRMIEDIASAKYDRHQIASDDLEAYVVVTSDDLP